MQLKNKVIIVTGAAQGLGLSIARRFAEEGAKVALVDINGQRVREVAATIDASIGIEADLSTRAGVAAAIAEAADRLGPVDVWAHNAAIAGSNDLLDYPEERWQQQWSVNTMAQVWAAMELVPGWLERGTGHFAQVVSVTALTLQHWDPAYAVTKRAALAFNEYLAVHYANTGIGVTAFCPRGMITPLLLESMETLNPAAKNAMATAVTPEHAADLLVKGVRDDRFLVLTEDDEIESHRAKAADYDGWIERRKRQYLSEKEQVH